MERMESTAQEQAEPRPEAWVKDSDLELKLDEQQTKRSSLWATVCLAYGSLGVIYGDIGTSVIYVFPAIFQDMDFTESTQEIIDKDIFGAISLIFWTLTLITLVKYIGIVLAANDTGEGGTVALYALLCRTMGISPFGSMKSQDFKQVLALTSAAPTGPNRPRLGEHRFKENARAKRREDRVTKHIKPVRPPIFRKSSGFRNLLILDGTNIIRWFRRNFIAQRVLIVITMLATGLVIGDGILMPAFSVVSAINGLRRETNLGDGDIVGISIAILAVLFFFQHIGTKKIGFLFSPIVTVWLLCNFGVGIYNLHTYGGRIFGGLSPHHIVRFFYAHPHAAWTSLGGVLLCVTGTETMFAAMGHFSRSAIAIAFGLFTYPCIMISYLGQGSYLLQNPLEVDTAFWSSIPRDFYWPMLVLATLAAVVASQAAITGTFSLLRQAMAMGIFPKLKIVHTGDIVEGQIFIPVINYILMVLCIAVVAGFQGNNLILAEAYGVAVISVMVLTTFLIILIMITAWETSLLIVIPFACLFLLIESGFLSSSLKKVPHGAWFAVVVSVTFALVMLIWWLGSLWRRRVVLANSKAAAAGDVFSVTTATPRGKIPVGLTDDTTDVARSAAGYAVFGSKNIEDNLAVELATAIASNKRASNAQLDFHRTNTDHFNSHVSQRHSSDRMSAPAGNRPILGRFSAAPAWGRAVPPPAAFALTRISSGNNYKSKNHVSDKDGPGPTPNLQNLSQPALPAAIPPEESAKRRSGSFHVRASPGLEPTIEEENSRLTVAGGNTAPTPSSPTLDDGKAKVAVEMEPGHGMNLGIPNVQTLRLNSMVMHGQHSKPDKDLALLSGLGIYYNETPVGIPEVLRHFLRNVDALHEVAIFLTVRFLPMPSVIHSERLLVKAVYGVPNFYQVVARYGYQDIVDHGEAFIAQVKATILHKLEIKAGLRKKGVSDDFIAGVEDDQEIEEDGGHGGGRGRTPKATNSMTQIFGLPSAEIERYTREREAHDIGMRGSKVDLMDGLPMMTRFADAAIDKLAEAAVAPGATQAAIDSYDAAMVLIQAFDEGVVYYLGRTWTRSKEGSKNPIHNIIIGTFFRTMELLAYHDSEAWHIPLAQMVELGMTVEV